MSAPPQVGVDEFVMRLATRPSSAPRLVVGVAGPPGVGKSTLAERLRLDAGAVVAPMDGFHRPNDELDALGLRDRKGAPETFDGAAFIDRVAALAAAEHDVPWPAFDRGADAPVADALVVPAAARLVVVEGNYLLLRDQPWRRLRDLLDEIAHLELDAAVRRARLVDRHVAHGRDPAAAVEWVDRSDEANARLIDTVRGDASYHVVVD